MEDFTFILKYQLDILFLILKELLNYAYTILYKHTLSKKKKLFSI